MGEDIFGCRQNVACEVDIYINYMIAYNTMNQDDMRSLFRVATCQSGLACWKV